MFHTRHLPVRHLIRHTQRSYVVPQKRIKPRTRKQGKTYPKGIHRPDGRFKFPAWREVAHNVNREEDIRNAEIKSLEVSRSDLDRKFLTDKTTDEFLNYNHSWASFYHQVAQSVPRSLLSNPVYPKLPDSWFSRTFSAYEMGKPSFFFDKQFNSKKNIDDWKTGYKSARALGKFFDKYRQNFTQFNTRDRPLNPFRYKPHLVNRISVKNPRLLFPFITESGKIKSRVYTGLKTRAQKKVTKEIKKMRMLGLTGYGHNPEYGKDHSQPHATFMGFQDFVDVTNALENHEKRKKKREMTLKQKKIVWERDFDTRRQLRREYFGLTDDQIAEKKKEFKKLVMENEYLKTLGRSTPITTPSPPKGKTTVDDLLVDNKPPQQVKKEEDKKDE